MTDKEYLEKAIDLSKESVEVGGFPVGALVVLGGKIVADGLSNGKQLHDATSHAETEALRKASKKLSSRDLNGAIVYSSMEPCLMCFSACYWAKVKKVVYAIGKESLPKIHYEGLHNLEEINKVNNRQIEIVHLKELEAKAFEVINEWRTKISKK